MSSIDKDPKRTVSKPTDKKFFLGFSDGYAPREKWMVLAFLSNRLRRLK